MKVIDPGHKYELASFDGETAVVLTFVKRNDPPEKYPGNLDAYPGTQTQEVLRALIERAHYVNAQDYSAETAEVIELMRKSILLLEKRHARRHGETLVVFKDAIEDVQFHDCCGHITCYCERKND